MISALPLKALEEGIVSPVPGSLLHSRLQNGCQQVDRDTVSCLEDDATKALPCLKVCALFCFALKNLLFLTLGKH